MGLGPVELNGVISRTQDYSVIKQNEDNKGIVNQQAFQNTFEKELDIRHTQVGDNEYYGNGGRQRKKEKNPNGKVIVKGRQSFDMKI